MDSKETKIYNRRLTTEDFEQLKELHQAYKKEIMEEEASKEDLEKLFGAIEQEVICFYGSFYEERLVACISISPFFSTFNYRSSALLEDFYIVPLYRGKGIAREMISFAIKESQIGSLLVGSAPCDEKMYASLGFSLPLGRLLAYDIGKTGE